MAIKKISANLLGNNAVTAASIAGGAISAADIADNSITAAKISTSTFAIDSLTVNTSDLVVDTANNRVGIGTTNPSYKLEVAGDASFLGQDVLIDSQSGYKELRHTQTGENFAISSPESLYFIMDSNNDQTSRSIVFAHNNTAPGSATELMRIGEDGNVGIGTTNPVTILHVNSGANGEILRIQGANAQLRINNSTLNVMDINSSGSGDSLTLSTDDTERMRIDSSGNVGIGGTPTNGGVSTAANPVLQIIGTVPELNFVDTSVGADDWFIRTSDGLGFGNSTTRVTFDNSGNVGIGNTIAATMDLSNASANLVVGTGSGAEGITIYSGTTSYGSLCFADGAFSTNTYSGYITYYHSSNHMEFGANGGTERMRIDSSGNLLVGTTSDAGVATNTKLVLGGIFSTHKSNASVASATTTTIATLPSGDGNYIVSAALLNSTGPSAYNEVAIVGISGSSSTITTLQNAGALNLSMSGLNLQVYHNQGATQTILFSILRIL